MPEVSSADLEDLLRKLGSHVPVLEIFNAAREIEAHGSGGDQQDQLLVEIYRGCLERGLTYSASPAQFLEASQRLSRLLFRYGREREANNYLLYLRDLPGEKPVPEWVFSYTAKLEYIQDLAFTIQHPAVVLKPISRALALNPQDRQAHAVIADFVISAAAFLIQEQLQDKAEAFSDAMDLFLEENSSIDFSIVRRALLDIDSLTERDSRPIPAAEVPDAMFRVYAHREPDSRSADSEGTALRRPDAEARGQLAESRAEIASLHKQLRHLNEENESLRKALADARAAEPHSSAILDEGTQARRPTEVLPAKAPDELLPPRSRILVLGSSTIAEQKLTGICKQLGIAKEQIEFVLEYQAFDHIDFRTLKYNNAIAGILIGPVPHKVPGCDDPANTLQREEGYPPTVKVESSNGELKITKSSFRASLEKLLVKIGSNEPASFH